MNFSLQSLIVFVVVRNAFSLPSATDVRENREDFDLDDAESFIQSLASLPLDSNLREELVSAFPHEFNSYAAPAHEYGVPEVPAPTYGLPVSAPIAVPAPAVGVTVNKYAVLAPHVEVFRFLEAFVQFKTELIARVQQLINNNWDLILTIINFVLGKLQNLQGVLLILISFLRQILEFGLSLLSQFSINLPSVSVGVSGHVDPIPSFNLNSVISAASGWFNG
ncbi:hypothetical protein FQR65_LT03180 [Abscondita terminalis]|nr:hypothetical protein FQR65_LT03180 [Abscondita terminalis]